MLAGSTVVPALAQPVVQPAVSAPMQAAHPTVHATWKRTPMMRRMMENAPIPMLMPIVLRNAMRLELTPTQDADITAMLHKQRQQFPVWHQAMMSHNKALRTALLNGESGKELIPLKKAVIQDRRMMLNKGIRQVEYLHKILTPIQWQHTVKMAEHPWHRGTPLR